MGDTYRRQNDDYAEKRIKRVKKDKRIVDKYRRVIHNYDSSDDAFDEYLEYEFKQNKTKTR